MNQIITGSKIMDKKAVHKATGPKEMPKSAKENTTTHPGNAVKPMRNVDGMGRNHKANHTEKVNAG